MIDSLNLRLDCFIGVIQKGIEIETNTQHFDEFFFYKIVKNENIVFYVFACNLSKTCDTETFCTSNEWLKSLFFGIFYVQYSKTQPGAPQDLEHYCQIHRITLYFEKKFLQWSRKIFEIRGWKFLRSLEQFTIWSQAEARL